ncbi:TetR/AcrR family transcriptional regulator [Falsiruegeria mediterranea]|uniref:HTH-type transcriptional regulator RutR n=1 Tax=Falsiruegeria mediterranea M17 TaxID=1200281 RepID=A0A2R8CCB0_9RHOB|nr:TetR/AcrR family transcriptional regulator [Falsiruegeria mediterranea]SPJ30037.1 HTH-type transcriptional regulator RutR [Falsiruegeria mediterranea M17]
MGKMEAKREAKRRAILGAAQDEFLSVGFEAANMDRIAAAAEVTKQTVYRYFPSKIDLFEATLQLIGQSSGADFLHHLEGAEPRTALVQFAEGFMRWHLEDEPLRVFRLLVAESARSPEVVSTFFTAAPDQTNAALAMFFTQRLGVAEPEAHMNLLTSMLLAHRDDALLGRGRPDDHEIARHAEMAVRVVLADLGVPSTS